MREMALCLALLGLTATATTQSVTAPENWMPIGCPAQTITGRVTFTPSEITFYNGKSLPLARGGQMLFRPEAKKKKIMADLYRVRWTPETGHVAKTRVAAVEAGPGSRETDHERS
jgi:hypothetical protein